MDNQERLSKLNQGKLDAAMNKIYQFNEGVMSLKDFLAKHPPVSKRTYVQEYTKKRIHLCYEKIKNPSPKYYIEYKSDKFKEDGTLLVQVPKMYWDSLDIPDTTPQN